MNNATLQDCTSCCMPPYAACAIVCRESVADSIAVIYTAVRLLEALEGGECALTYERERKEQGFKPQEGAQNTSRKFHFVLVVVLRKSSVRTRWYLPLPGFTCFER